MSFTSRLGTLAIGKVATIFAVATLLPIALLAYLSVTLGDHGLRDQAKARLVGVSVSGGKFVSQEMNSEAAIVESFSGRSTVVDALSKGSGAYDSAALGSQLDDLKSARAGVSVTFLTDPAGRLISGRPDNPKNVGQDFSSRDWFRGVTASGHTYVSNAFISAAPGAPAVVAIATPVRNSSGAVIGYIGANYGLDSLQNLVRDLSRSQGVDMSVTDRASNVVASPQAQRSSLVSMKDDPRVAAALRGGGVESIKRNGHEMLSAGSLVEGLNWGVIAEVPARSALAPINSLRVAILSMASVLSVIALLAIGLLVTSLRERSRSAANLATKEKETRSILNASADAYLTMDARGQITSWSEQAANTFGWQRADALGRTVAELIVPPEQREQHERGLARFLETGVGTLLNKRIEVEAVHRDGHRFPLELAIWVIETTTTPIFSAFCRDITERQEFTTQLADARDRAMESSRLKSEFVANMSHEIRTPLNGVIGMADLLERTDLNEEQQQYSATILHSAEALLDVISDILDFSKIEAGRMEVDNIAFDLRSVVEEAGELIASTAQTKGLELTINVEPGVETSVKGDPARIRQVLLNLVGNAVKFTDHGEVDIRCFAVSNDTVSKATVSNDTVSNGNERQSVRIEVADTGPGIRQADIGRLFQSFSQLDASATRNYGGTGLGLAISKRLVELMGGEIGVNSIFGAGSTFWFTIPMELCTNPVMSLRSNDYRSLAGRRTLIVDDNATNLTILERTLAGWGMVCQTASNAQEAMSSAQEACQIGQPFELAIIDFNMPDTNGLELGHMFQQDPALLSSMKMILLTSSGEHGEGAGAQDRGFVGYLTKPVRQSALIACLFQGLEMRAPADLVVIDTESVPSPDTFNPRILVAEDNVVNQAVMCRMLEAMGYEVDVVENGRDALVAIEKRVYAAAMMDCQMPVLDGYNTTRRLREKESGDRHLPVIAVTAHALTGDLERCLDAGMDDYLSKPVTWDALASKLALWVRDPQPLQNRE